jgi:hypothetical protein
MVADIGFLVSDLQLNQHWRQFVGWDEERNPTTINAKKNSTHICY